MFDLINIRIYIEIYILLFLPLTEIPLPIIDTEPLCSEVSHGREEPTTAALTLSRRRWRRRRLSRSDGINAIAEERERERGRERERERERERKRGRRFGDWAIDRTRDSRLTRRACSRMIPLARISSPSTSGVYCKLFKYRTVGISYKTYV